MNKEYISRINKVFDFIEKNIENSYTLEELAKIANFSKFHFHRIFFAMVGETPNQFAQRLRLEKAAYLMLINKEESLTEIAYKCGFSDISVFSRNFKSYFNQSPSDYRKNKQADSNIRQKESKNEKSDDAAWMYFCAHTRTIKWKTNMELNKSVEIKDFPKMNVAYVRHIGPYAGNEGLFEKLWNKLFAWAGPRGLLEKDDMQSLIIYHDDPNVTEQEKLRMSVCITVPKDTKVDGEVGMMEVDGGKYVVARFEVDASQFGKAWEWVYGQWFPNSGYQPDDRPSFEMYPEEPKDGKFTVDICVPVKPL